MTQENFRTRIVVEMSFMSDVEIKKLCETMPSPLRERFIRGLQDTNEIYPKTMHI